MTDDSNHTPDDTNETFDTFVDVSSDTLEGEPEIPLVDGRYQIFDCVGRGGMGAVYKAFDRALDEVVALKALRPEVATDPRARLFFKREVKLARRVTHPKIARTFDLSISESNIFLTMEFIDGHSLRETLKSGPLDPSRIESIATDILEALAAAHSVGVVHRDLKPDNVMVRRDGSIVLTDFGIATLMATDGDGGIVGTAAYIAPEQARGLPVDARSDLYALGVMLYELSTGSPPFQAPTAMATMMKRLIEDPPQLPDHVPARLRATIEACLQREPNDRPDSAEDVLALLDETFVPSGVFVPNYMRSHRPFFGRVQELETLRDEVSRRRRVAVVGVGGMGKTRLVNEYAGRVLEAFEQNVWTFELAGVEKEDDLLARINEVFPDTNENPVDAIRPIVSKFSDSLLIVDSVESDVAQSFVQTLAQSVDSSIVITSRRRVDDPAFFELRLTGLDEDDAVKMLTAALPDDTNLTHASEVVRLIDYSPLAIELVTPRLRMFSLERLAERLNENIEIARTKSSTVQSRHRALSDVIRGSWELLSDDAQFVMGQLTAFQGSASFDAIAAVVEFDGLLEDALEELLESSFVDWRDDRFFLLNSIREFVSTEVTLDPGVATRHAQFYATLYENGEQSNHRELVKDRYNLFRAIHTALDERATDLLGSLLSAYEIVIRSTGPFSRIAPLVDRAIELAPDDIEIVLAVVKVHRRVYDSSAIFRLIDRALTLKPTPIQEAELRRNAAIAHRGATDFLLAIEQLELALALAEQEDDQAMISLCCNNLAVVLHAVGREDESDAMIVRATEIAESIGDQHLIGLSHANHGANLHDRGQLKGARYQLTKGIAFFERTGDRLRELVTRMNLAVVKSSFGDFEGAVTDLELILRAHERIGSQRALAFTHKNLAFAYSQLGRTEEAHAHLDASERFRTKRQSRDIQATIHADRAAVFEAEGRFDDAIAASVKSLESIDDVRRCESLVRCGYRYLLGGDLPTALEYLAQAEQAPEIRGDIELGEFNCLKGIILVETGDTEQARLCWNTADQIRRDLELLDTSVLSRRCRELAARLSE